MPDLIQPANSAPLAFGRPGDDVNRSDLPTSDVKKLVPVKTPLGHVGPFYLGTGSFDITQNARGDWYLKLSNSRAIKVPESIRQSPTAESLSQFVAELQRSNQLGLKEWSSMPKSTKLAEFNVFLDGQVRPMNLFSFQYADRSIRFALVGAGTASKVFMLPATLGNANDAQAFCQKNYSDKGFTIRQTVDTRESITAAGTSSSAKPYWSQSVISAYSQLSDEDKKHLIVKVTSSGVSGNKVDVQLKNTKEGGAAWGNFTLALYRLPENLRLGGYADMIKIAQAAPGQNLASVSASFKAGFNAQVQQAGINFDYIQKIQSTPGSTPWYVNALAGGTLVLSLVSGIRGGSKPTVKIPTPQSGTTVPSRGAGQVLTPSVVGKVRSTTAPATAAPITSTEVLPGPFKNLRQKIRDFQIEKINVPAENFAQNMRARFYEPALNSPLGVRVSASVEAAKNQSIQTFARARYLTPLGATIGGLYEGITGAKTFWGAVEKAGTVSNGLASAASVAAFTRVMQAEQNGTLKKLTGVAGDPNLTPEEKYVTKLLNLVNGEKFKAFWVDDASLPGGRSVIAFSAGVGAVLMPGWPGEEKKAPPWAGQRDGTITITSTAAASAARLKMAVLHGTENFNSGLVAELPVVRLAGNVARLDLRPEQGSFRQILHYDSVQMALNTFTTVGPLTLLGIRSKYPLTERLESQLPTRAPNNWPLVTSKGAFNSKFQAALAGSTIYNPKGADIKGVGEALDAILSVKPSTPGSPSMKRE
jgi:3D (Asp-Asp-Asp) domain-containing protein